jgi:hypothetical protein
MNIKIFIIKLLIISIIFIIFGLLGFIIGIFLDQHIFIKYNVEEYKNKERYLIWLDIALQLMIFGIILFLGRSIFSQYLLPIFDYFINKNNDIITEEKRDIKSTFAFIFTLTLLYVQYNLKLKLDHLAGIKE